MKCNMCQFWERNGPDGICRRDNPKPIIIQSSNLIYSIVWPRTSANEWCGKFKSLSEDETERNYTQS